MNRKPVSPEAVETAPVEPGLSPVVTAVFAAACGAMVANIYYAQPLIEPIGAALGIQPSLLGFIVTLTQLGYGAGLMLLVPLADLVENKLLILCLTGGAVAGLIGTAISTSPLGFLCSSALVGFCSVGAQVLIPLAAHLTPERTRGRMIGNVMAGLLGGIMLSRPLASFIAAHLGWRAVFWVSAATMSVLAVLLWRILPRRQPSPGMHYGQILLSTVRLLPATPIVLRRAIYQGTLFAAFNLFWTASPLLLHGVFKLTQSGIALFALAGAGGALAAPIAGRLADRGLTAVTTGCAMLAVILSFLVAGWAAATAAMWALVFAAIALDAGTQTNQVVSQRVIYGLLPHARGRINAIYMVIMFMLGATGSALAPVLYFRGGWWLTALSGAGLAAAALAFFTTEYRGRAAGRS